MKRSIHHLFFPIAAVCSQLVRSKQRSLLAVIAAKDASPEARKREEVRERENDSQLRALNGTWGIRIAHSSIAAQVYGLHPIADW